MCISGAVSAFFLSFSVEFKRQDDSSPGGLRDAEIPTIYRERYSKSSPLTPQPAKGLAGGWRRGLWHPGPTFVRLLCFNIIPDSGLEPRRGGGSASRLSPRGLAAMQPQLGGEQQPEEPCTDR